jgi:hypothetical protein
MSENQFKLTKKNNPIIGNNKNKNSALSEINSGNRLITTKSFSLEYIKTNSIFLGKIDKKIDELKKDTKFMQKEIASKILLLYDKFKISLESSNYTVPKWQYNFFNTILETQRSNNIENSIREFNNNFVTLPLDINRNNKRINLDDSFEKKSLSVTPPLFNNNNNNNTNNTNNNMNTINASDILKRLISEKEGFSKFTVVVKNGEILLRGSNGEKCFAILIDSDNIYIDNLSKCTIKGVESLEIVENLAKRMSNIKYIRLIDLSDINIFSSKKPINLAILKILTNGESWYNSLGYISGDDTEKTHNKKIIDGDYLDFVLNLIEKIGKKGHNSIELPKIIHICHELYPPLVSQSVRNYFNNIWDEIKKSEEKFKNNWFAEYLNIIGGTNILKYNMSLTKKIKE